MECGEDGSGGGKGEVVEAGGEDGGGCVGAGRDEEAGFCVEIGPCEGLRGHWVARVHHVVHHVLAGLGIGEACLAGFFEVGGGCGGGGWVFEGEAFGYAVVGVGDVGVLVAGHLTAEEIHEGWGADEGPDQPLHREVCNRVDEGGAGHEEVGDEAVFWTGQAVEAFAEDQVTHHVVGEVGAEV